MKHSSCFTMLFGREQGNVGNLFFFLSFLLFRVFPSFFPLSLFFFRVFPSFFLSFFHALLNVDVPKWLGRGTQGYVSVEVSAFWAVTLCSELRMSAMIREEVAVTYDDVSITK